MIFPVAQDISLASPDQSRSSAMPPLTSSRMVIPTSSKTSDTEAPLNNSITPKPAVGMFLREYKIPQPASCPTTSLVSTRAQKTNIDAGTTHEVAFLLKYFAEGPGEWMDLFDLGNYFTSDVPVRARSSLLLQNATCAYAAKQLRRATDIKNHMEVSSGKCNALTRLGARCYEQAIQLLIKQLQPDVEATFLSSEQEAIEQCPGVELHHDSENPHSQQTWIPTGKLSMKLRSDDILVSVAILSMYEFLDGTGLAWTHHLSGFKSFLDIAKAGKTPINYLQSNSVPHNELLRSNAYKAAFWNFARQDYLAAFINECHTNLNTDDLLLWTEFGLLLDPIGFMQPTTIGYTAISEGENLPREEQVCNTLVWILSKIVNHINSCDNVNASGFFGRWYRLEAELDAWYKRLPEIFKHCTRVDLPRTVNYRSIDNIQSLTRLQEIRYSIPMCASSMQHYHMAQILLLINKPHQPISSPSTIFLRLQSYRTLEAETRFHSHEILGIGLARPDGSVRTHSLQPLFVAGQCLANARERCLVIQLLRGIEADLGWATGIQVQQLLREWGW
ncbi:Transcription activator AMTR1 [Penicillium atrosanguineum]|nr:Transcription activator AMTR1 [Penicillium atrosanguineum]